MIVGLNVSDQKERRLSLPQSLGYQVNHSTPEEQQKQNRTPPTSAEV